MAKFLNVQSGATAIEHALIAGAMPLVLVAMMGQASEYLSNMFGSLGDALAARRRARSSRSNKT